jgi:hypothetical protein
MKSAHSRKDRLSAWRPGRIALHGLAGMLCAALAGFAANYDSQTVQADTGKEVVASPTPKGPDAAGTAQTRALMYMKSLTVKKYGWLAHQVGYQDSSESLTVFDPRKDWWMRPALLYQEMPISDPDIAGGADCEVMKGIGKSSNVDVTVALTCHAVVALKTMPKADCMKGTIKATLIASASFFEGHWHNVVTVKDKPFVFKFDTCDGSRPIKATGTESRSFQISFEAYTRAREFWSPKTTWPRKPERADIQIVLYARDAQLEITGYRYDDVSSTTPKK